MRKTIGFVIFLIIIFIVNLVFYFLSEDYRFFLKKIKDTDQTVYLEEKEITDEKKLDDEIPEDEIIEKKVTNIEVADNDEEKKILEGAEVVKLSTKNDSIFELKDTTELKSDVSLGKNYQTIINLFSIYNLSRLEMNSNLFDLTDEYPDNYFEYYSKDLTLYLFPTKTYTELNDIFSVLVDELPFTLNETNSFGDNSFYINLSENIEDRFVRIVISNKGVVFGLKIKKTEYNLVRDKLNSLKIVPEEN
ncbi:MAG: hypothetical protein QM490_00885 [Candidatus Gracilibacteria bacterium]